MTASDDRVLVLMPTARDGERTRAALTGAGLECAVCGSMGELCREIPRGAGTALLTEEALAADRDGRLPEALRRQPAWSDFPLVLVARAWAGGRSEPYRETANVSLVERPVRIRSLLSVVRAALRSRRHQYAIRDLIAEREQAAAALRAQREALEAALNGAPLDGSLGVLARTATEVLGSGTRAAFYLANGDGTALEHVVGMSSDYAEAVRGFKIGADSLACGLATATGEPVLTTDVMAEPRWERWRWMAERFDYRGCWSFPVRTAAGTTVGTFAVYWRQPRTAAARDLDLAALLTRTAAIIVSRHTEAEARRAAEQALRRANDELEGRVRARTAELTAALEALEAEMARRRDLTQRLATAQEDERRRVSRDLHDTVGQLLAGLSLALKAVENSGDLPPPAAARLAEAQRVMNDLGREVHGLAVRLRPTSLDDVGLDAALGQLVSEWSARTGVRAEFHATGAARLPGEVETAVYRVVQEALTNVAKHARASAVTVVVARPGGSVSVVIEDDGAGFDPAAPPKGRLGLVGMRERVELVGGEIDVDSSPGSGTTVAVQIPVPKGGGAP